MSVKSGGTVSARPLLGLLDLGRRVRQTDDPAVMRFMAVNDSHQLATYRQAALWVQGQGVQALSGVVKVEANAPYAQWLHRVNSHLFGISNTPLQFSAALLPNDLGSEWAHWLPEYGFWLPIKSPDESDAPVSGGLLLARDLPWTESDMALLTEWIGIWSHAWFSLHRSRGISLRRRLWFWLGGGGISLQHKVWWKRRSVRIAVVILLVLAIPVRLVVLAPGELVPANAVVVRSPLEGVIAEFHVQPNQQVHSGDLLFTLDEALLLTRLNVARQALATADAEYRQAAQQALTDDRSKALLSTLTGRIEERRSEAAFLEQQLGRTRVTAVRDGIVLFDDLSEWIGRPVVVGERIMRIAEPGDMEVEAWVSLSDAIPVAADAPVSLYLNSSPLDPVRATLRFIAHDAMERPDGSFAYRLRATLNAPVSHRVGLEGTARMSGRWVPFGYWLLRRPAATLRGWIGL